jgi:hypothetical protein
MREKTISLASTPVCSNIGMIAMKHHGARRLSDHQRSPQALTRRFGNCTAMIGAKQLRYRWAMHTARTIYTDTFCLLFFIAPPVPSDLVQQSEYAIRVGS